MYTGDEHYERLPRTVGACVKVDEKQVVFTALDEDGTLVDRYKTRWLLTNIRSLSASAIDTQVTAMQRPCDGHATVM